MKRRFIIIIAVIVILIGILFLVTYSDNQLRFKLSYEYINNIEYSNGKKIKVSIPSNNRIKYMHTNEILDFLNSGTGILYFGYNTCPWCRNAVPILIESVIKNNINRIYYVDIHKLDLSSIKEELYLKLDSYLTENSEGKKIISVPSVYFILDGKIMASHIGTVDSYRNPYSKMTVEQEKELLGIYEKCIGEIKQ